MNYHKIIKTIIIGNADVGKSSLCHKIINNEIPIAYSSTVGVDFFAKIYEFNDFKLKLHIWDTAGQEKFKTLTKSFFRQAEFVILMFNYNDIESFNSLQDWLNLFNKYCCVDKPYIIVIGNKLDLKKNVDFTNVQDFCIKNNLKLYNTSLKKNNFEIIFYDIIKYNFAPDNFKLISYENNNINIMNQNKKCFGCC
jgi:Ras-related protein Rab-1A